MVSFKLSQYVQTIENRLIKGVVQRALFHRLTGEIAEIVGELNSLLSILSLQRQLDLDTARTGPLAQYLIDSHFLVQVEQDPVVPFLDHYVVRPLQNPALGYRNELGEVSIARVSMSEYVFGRHKGDLPKVIDEPLPALASIIFTRATGTMTLRQLFESAGVLPDSAEANESLDYLTALDRQLIKLTPFQNDLSNPLIPCNIIGRDLRHASESDKSENIESVSEFHRRAIEDAAWEFEQIEPTINHAFRFESEALGGLNYGGRFFRSVLDAGLISRVGIATILEVGGGTGSFAKSFLEEVARSGLQVDYHILDLSPVLIDHQKQVLTAAGFQVTHFNQDATEMDLQGKLFDLVVSNEVIADFPVAEVRRILKFDSTIGFEGDGSKWIEKYKLEEASGPNGPAEFLVNSGVFQFLERAWDHLRPGGAMVVTEYGTENAYPLQAYQLNHEEFSIHFGHVKRCAEQIGFRCELVPLREFMKVNDQTMVLDGRELRILCLNHVFRTHAKKTMPYAAFSHRQFEMEFKETCDDIGVVGLSFSPLQGGFHFTPEFDAFMALIVQKPNYCFSDVSQKIDNA